MSLAADDDLDPCTGCGRDRRPRFTPEPALGAGVQWRWLHLLYSGAAGAWFQQPLWAEAESLWGTGPSKLLPFPPWTCPRSSLGLPQNPLHLGLLPRGCRLGRASCPGPFALALFPGRLFLPLCIHVQGMEQQEQVSALLSWLLCESGEMCTHHGRLHSSDPCLAAGAGRTQQLKISLSLPVAHCAVSDSTLHISAAAFPATPQGCPGHH